MKKYHQLRVWVGLILFWQLMAVLGCQTGPSTRRENQRSRGDVSAARTPATEKVESDSENQPKKRVAVFQFWNDTPNTQKPFGEIAARALRQSLESTGKVIVLSSEDSSALATENYVQGDQVKTEQLIREGRKLGMSVVIIGRLAKAIFRQSGDDVGLFRQKKSVAATDLEVKIFDVQTGREIMGATQSGESSDRALVAIHGSHLQSPEYRSDLTEEAIEDAVNQVIPQIIQSVQKLSWQGRIAKLAGNRFYINAGRGSGLIQGDILRVLTPGDDIYDPMSGAYLGRSQGRLKGTLEVADFLGEDASIAELHTGGNFREGDIVQLY